jgi:hypothetical protein
MIRSTWGFLPEARMSKAGRAPPFAQRIRAALNAARAAGAARVKIVDRDGASFAFDLTGEQSSEAEANDFDMFPAGKSRTLSIPRKT